MFRQQIRLSLFAVLAAFTLALTGCGGGGGGGDDPPMMPEPPDPQMVCEDAGGRYNADGTCTSAADLVMERQEMQRNAISTAIGMATTAVNAVDNDSTDSEVSAADTAIGNARTAIANAADLPQAEKDANSGTVNALYTQLGNAKTARQAALDDADDAMKAAIAKTGRLLRLALGGTPTAGSTALDNAAVTDTDLSDGLTIDAVAGAGALPDTGDGSDPAEAVLMAGDSAGSLGGWAGTDYAHSTGTGASKVTTEARVYTNRGMGRSVTFTMAGITIATAATTDDLVGYVTLDEADATTLGRIMAPAFMHSGTQDHPYDTVNQSAFTTRGTYAGAPGEYRCTGDCTSTNNGMGSPSGLGGVWHFKPDAGMNAMTHSPDNNYLYYGWWVSKNSDGEPTAASAFTGVNGTIAALASDPVSAVTGSATYAGHAAGKFAMSNTLEGTGNGGHFTADVNLTAKFGTNDAPNNGGVTGMIDNFRLNDGSEDPGWSLALHRAPWGTTGAFESTAAADTTANGTTWSINGNAAPESGTWNGQMYDELPGNTDDTPPGDGSNIPTTVTGTFYSEFSAIGRMVGAFGANKE